jgi:hypothetical protein
LFDTDLFLQLQKILATILRMLLVTYIMAHVLTIKRSTIEGVMRSMQHAEMPENFQGIKHISPRLANQQFKCHFSRIRAKLCLDLLNKFQAILSKFSGDAKESTWMRSFCLMLGFAMVLEEIQHTLYIQAHASMIKDPAAEQRFIESCKRMDERFALLTLIHQTRYRSRERFTEGGSFGPGTPNLQDAASHIFADKVRQLARSRCK